ncbi:leucine-rich repeat domain-containing protein [Fibrella sp. HMF5335]|uniref:Leucine-rich repeat domain-containing protein n=1 Tax=Fibrella rubiginis TaxID=2817060 RepID=A0A939GE99_9BACT|nr:leucine-rich repeat domain-containing protein [Fibrella rubiginis]MBO0935639.1 leucine-rich repeat domain-containing protein [Fibrella rubiginis]
MIRNALLVGGLLSIATIGWAQQKTADVQVILKADTAQFGVSPAQLAKTHIPFGDQVQALSDQAQTTPRKAMKAFNTAQMDLIKKISLVLATNVFFHYEAFYRADGTAEWVIVSPNEDASVQEVSKLLTELTQFYQGTPLMAQLPKPFALNGVYVVGRPSFVQKRTVRTGDSTISTLEAARLTNRPDTVRYVFFNQLNLKAIPDELYRFQNLEELDLSKNELTQLPLRLTADLPNLKRLSLLENQIGDDGIFFAKNTHLEALNVQYNKLTRVPKSVSNNRHLTSLWLGHNNLNELAIRPLKKLKRLYDLNLYEAGLTSIPKKIRKLKHLTILDLYHNDLLTLPKQMGKMKALEQLAVANNRLTKLPKELAKLPRLTTLFVHHNKLRELPAEMASLTNLRLLDIGSNQFSELPAVVLALPELQDLDLSGNNIQTLPATLAQLTKLKKLYMRSNPVTKDDAKVGPYARVIDQLEANKTEVFY